MTATIALVAAPLIGAAPAQAAPVGYTGTVVHGMQAWPDAVLGFFEEDVTYSDSLQAPFDFDDRDHGVAFDIGGTLPDGLTATVRGTRYVDITGTPTSSGPFSFSIIWYGTEGDYSELEFTVEVESGKLPLSTGLQVTSPVAAYSSITLIATLDPGDGAFTPPTGTVEFWTDPATWGSSVKVGQATVTPVWNASFAWTGMSASDVGSSRGFIAKYLGDETYAESDSDVAETLPYIPLAAGTVTRNGVAVSGATVRLLDATDTSIVVASGSSGSDGSFSLNPGTPSTVVAVQKQFIVEATYPGGTVVEYGSAVSRLTWADPLDIDLAVPPVWTDNTLTTPRAGSVYSDGVSATSPTAVTYSVSGGTLPPGLTLDTSSGDVTGTPTCAVEPCTYSFELKATNIAGWVTQTFSGTLLPAGVAPTWTDDIVRDDLQVGLALTDGVTATGDATIVFSQTGTLPPGLTFDTATGALTGTPTTAGTYTFRLTATNDYGTIHADFVRTVAAAPELGLHLNFAAGTSIDDADTDISASGLKVGSTYTLTMHSTPVVLYTGIIGPGGGFTWTVALPANTPAGPHELILSGIAPNGTTMTAHAWFLLLSNGTIAAISYTGPLSAAQLALTGGGLAPLGLSAVLLVAGAAALIVRRKLA